MRTLALLVVAGALILCGQAEATIHVGNTAEFNAAVDRIGNRAGTIVLERGRYGKLLVGPRSLRARWLTITARPGAVTRWVTLAGSRRVRLVNLHVTNYWGGDARLLVYRARGVKIQGATVVGKPGRRARIHIQLSSNVSLTGSDLSYCGNRMPCVRMPQSRGVSVVGNTFHDCYGCDFVVVARTSGITLARNTFDRALPVSGCPGSPGCWHQDLVQVIGGTNIRIMGNLFGDQANGAAQLYISGQAPTVGIEVRNNVFLPTEPGVAPTNGIILGNAPRSSPSYPRRAVIAGNTILSGAPRGAHHLSWAGVANSLLISEGYQTLPVEERPIVVNNVLATASHPEYLCPNGQIGYNFFITGAPCSELDLTGNPLIDPRGFPLEGSPLIGRGEPTWGAGRDATGWPRDETPDIGAYEWR